jgi:hypothetical protein
MEGVDERGVLQVMGDRIMAKVPEVIFLDVKIILFALKLCRRVFPAKTRASTGSARTVGNYSEFP